MACVFRYLSKMLEGSPTAHSRAEEAYLAEAADLPDLERRMREIDQRRAGIGSHGALVSQVATVFAH